jgi:hypothetical protein
MDVHAGHFRRYTQAGIEELVESGMELRPNVHDYGDRRHRIPTVVPTTLAVCVGGVDGLDTKVQLGGLYGHRGRREGITQIYEGTNQIQRIVIARHLLR